MGAKSMSLSKNDIKIAKVFARSRILAIFVIKSYEYEEKLFYDSAMRLIGVHGLVFL